MSSGRSDSKGAAEVADQLGAMPIEGTAKSDGTSGTVVENERFCSLCGKTGDGLKMCNGCKCVYYCSVACQKDHRGEHKKVCKRIEEILNSRGSNNVECAELLEPLDKDDVPSREDCPICMLPLPLDESRTDASPCCGKTICSSCNHEKMVLKMLEICETAQTEEQAQEIDFEKFCCPFCRALPPEDEADELKAIMRRFEANDAKAAGQLGMAYLVGDFGLRKDNNEGLFRLLHGANLGDPNSCYSFACIYYEGHFGATRNKFVAKKYWEKAAEGGHIYARENLAQAEKDNGNFSQAKRHWQIAAAAGGEKSVMCLIACFQENKLCHKDLAICLQTYDKAWIGMRSEQRSNYERFLRLEEGTPAREQYWRDRAMAIRARQSN